MKTAFTNYLPSNQNPNKCAVCDQNMLNKTDCACCGRFVCRNKCTTFIKTDDVAQKPWMSRYVGKYICKKCLPEYKTASETYVKSVFANIFANEDETNQIPENIIVQENEIDNSIKLLDYTSEQKDTDKKNDINENETMDKLIGGILSDLDKHGNIKFTEAGNIDSSTIRSIVNSIEELVNYPKMY